MIMIMIMTMAIRIIKILIIIMKNYWMRFCDIRNNQCRGKCYQPSRRPRLITLIEFLIILDITKTESNNCFIIHCFEENNDKHTVVKNLNYWKSCIARATYKISQLSASR